MTDQQQKNRKAYDDALSKGQRLLEILRTDNAIPQSQFLDTGTFEHWGYTGGHHDIQMKQQALLYIQGKLGIDKASNESISHDHSEDTLHGRCPATNAEFTSIINPAGGMIVAVDNTSPTQRKLEDDLPGWKAGSMLPELKFWSDIVYLHWSSVVSNTDNLKYIVRLGIQNEETTAVIEHIMASKEDHEQYPGWGKASWAMGSNEATALLGTPNGAGIVYLLAQHRTQLGLKTLGKAHLVYNENGLDD